MKSDILKRLIQAHADGDEQAFHKAALQLASSESAAGHVRIADDLRQIIAKMGPPTPRSRPVVALRNRAGSSRTSLRAAIAMNGCATSSFPAPPGTRMVGSP